MNKNFKLKASLLIAAMLALSVAQAENISKDDYKASKTRISADYQADKKACASLAANAKDICVEEAKAREKVARAELEFSYSGKSKDQIKIDVAKAESSYAVAKEKCDDLAGHTKDVCVKEAKTIEIKALADAKMGKKIGEAMIDSAEAKNDANYKLATEKCEALAGDTKTSCLTTAKLKFHKI
jgi:hypothetical protein